MARLKHLYSFLWIFVLCLIITGGYQSAILEVSQVDAFGYALLFFGLVHFKKTGHYFPSWILDFAKKLTLIPSVSLAKLFLGGFSLILLAVLTEKHRLFKTSAFDLGYIDQAVWSTAFLKLPEGFLHSSISKNSFYFGEHFSPVLAVMAPFYKLLPTTYWLYGFQVALLALSASLLWKLCSLKKLPKEIALFIFSCFLLYQPIRGAAFFSFREDLFFTPLIFLFLIAIESSLKSWKRVFSYIGLTLSLFLVKENAPIITIFLSLILFYKKERAVGSLIFILSLIWFLYLNGTLMPLFSLGAEKTVFAARFASIGGSPRGILENFLQEPLRTTVVLFAPFLELKTWKYLLLVLFPFAIWFHRSIYLIPIFFLSFLNVYLSPRSVGFHYELLLIPFLFAFLAEAAFLKQNKFNLEKISFLLIVPFLCTFGRSPALEYRKIEFKKEYTCLRKALAVVPEFVSVNTMDGLFTPLCHRKDIAMRSNPTQISEDVVIYSPLENISRYGTPGIENWIYKLPVLNENYTLLFESSFMVTYCHKSMCPHLEKLKKDTVIATAGCLE